MVEGVATFLYLSTAATHAVWFLLVVPGFCVQAVCRSSPCPRGWDVDHQCMHRQLHLTIVPVNSEAVPYIDVASLSSSQLIISGCKSVIAAG